MPLLKNLLAVVQDLFGRGRPKRKLSRRKAVTRKRRPVARKRISKPRRLTKKSVAPVSRKKTAGKTILKTSAKRGDRLKPVRPLPVPLSAAGEIKAVTAGKAKTARMPTLGRQPVGVVTHYFPKIMVCVVRVTQGELRRGDRVRIRGGALDFTQSVQSLQVESVDVAVAREGQLVGMKVIQQVHPGDTVEKLPAR